MVKFVSAVRRRRLSLALGTSTLACGLFLPATAHAQCAPDPTTANGTTTCSGTDTNGLTVDTANTQIVVQPGATVPTGTATAAITVTSINDSVIVNGKVNGTGKPGIAVTAGPATTVPCDPYAGASVSFCTPGTPVVSYPSASATLNVAAGATVTGSQALLISRNSSNTSGFVNVTIDNAGTLTGTAGPQSSTVFPRAPSRERYRSRTRQRD